MLLWSTLPGLAHFSDGEKQRTLLFTSQDTETTVYVRMPLALAFGDVITSATAGPDDPSSPFLYSKELENGLDSYWISLAEIELKRRQFTARLGQSLLWKTDRHALAQPGRVRAYRITGNRPIRPFESVAAAKNALVAPGAQLDPNFGEAWIEMAISIPSDGYSVM